MANEHGDLGAPTYVRLRERLRADIVAGLWPLGHHVTLSDLSAHYQVSGNPVREALLHLEGDGVVTMRMHRGAVIPQVDRAFVDNVYDINAALAVMLIRAVVRRVQPGDQDAIERAAEVFEQAANQGDVVAMVAANRAFHRTINDIAGNPPATEVLRGRLTLIDALRVAIGYRPGRLDEIVAQHRDIAAAIGRRHGAAAAAIVNRHVQSAKDDLLSQIGPDQAGPKPPPLRRAARQ